jgi:hypothetical protein
MPSTNAISFVLEHLNDSYQLTEAGTLDDFAVTIPTDAHVTAVFHVSRTLLQDTFKFQSDALDISNVEASDVKYYVYPANFPPDVNVAHAMLHDDDGGSASAGYSTYTVAARNRSLLKHDFVRYLSVKLFNTVHGVDLFDNETELLQNIVAGGIIIKDGINTKLTNIGISGVNATGESGSRYLTNGNTDTNNIGRIIMRQIAASDPERFKDILNQDSIQSIPFVDGDALYFKVTLQAATGQHTLTNVPQIPERVYLIKLLAKDTLANVTVTDF